MWQEWYEGAKLVDEAATFGYWREEMKDEALELRTFVLNTVRKEGSFLDMAIAANKLISRTLNSLGNVHIYDHALVHSPKVIRDYVGEICLLAHTIATMDVSEYERDDIDLIFTNILRVRHRIGNTALFLSGGSSLGMCHMGVVKALWEQGVLPRIITGASAGSIVCSILCSSTDDEIPGLLSTFHESDLAVFDYAHNPTTFDERLNRVSEGLAWADIDHLRRLIHNFLGDITFSDAYNKTRRICNISVSSSHPHDHTRLLNYITAPNVTIASAVVASCAVPFFFQASGLTARDPETGEIREWNDINEDYIDGSVQSDLPLKPVSEMFNVTETIVSQVNPHVTLLGLKEDSERAKPTLLSSLFEAAQDEAYERVSSMTDADILHEDLNAVLTKLASVASQDYNGHVTIITRMAFKDTLKVMQNPDTEFMKAACRAGERSTWPKLQRIKDRGVIEYALDDCLYKLRTRFAFEEGENTQARRRMLFSASGRRPSSVRRRSSAGNVHLMSDMPGPLTAEKNEQPELRRTSQSQQFPVVGGISMIPARRPRARMMPPFQHPDTFRREARGGIDFSRPLSPAESDFSEPDFEEAGDAAVGEENDGIWLKVPSRRRYRGA